MYPTISEYNTEIFKFGSSVLTTLSEYEFIPSRTLPVKIFSYGNGSYAVVFKAKHLDENFAIRCFISANQTVFWRYKKIDNYLKGLQENWVTKFDYIENGINIRGQLLPMVKMEWVDGLLLNKYISKHIHDNNALEQLQRAFVELSDRLEYHKISHGDIQCGNVIIQGDPENPIIRLIDFDGMYIPEFENLKCLERGRSEFQHPLRDQMVFDEKLDRFSFWVIITALEALKYNKDLWLSSTQGGYNTLDNLLFIGTDFSNFNASTLVHKLYSFNIDALNFYLNKLNEFCYKSSLIIDKPCLFDQQFEASASSTTNLETNATKDNDNNSDIVASIPVGKRFNLTKPTIGHVTIKSFPEGAIVLGENHERYGQTPLILNKTLLLHKRIILTYGTKFQSFEIHTDTIDIFHQFEEPKTTDNFEATILGPEDEETDYTILAQSHNIQIPKEKNNYSVWGWVALFIIIAMIVMYAFLHNKDSIANMGAINATVDSVAVTADTTAMTPVTVDTSSVRVESAIGFDRLDDFEHRPEDVLRIFFNELSNSNYDAAFDVTYNPIWEKKGKNWFTAKEHFGGINGIEIVSIVPLNVKESDVSFSVNFKRSHELDGKQCYNQVIYLNNLLMTDNKRRWMITKTKNIVEPYFCE